MANDFAALINLYLRKKQELNLLKNEVAILKKRVLSETKVETKPGTHRFDAGDSTLKVVVSEEVAIINKDIFNKVCLEMEEKGVNMNFVSWTPYINKTKLKTVDPIYKEELFKSALGIEYSQTLEGEDGAKN